MNNTSSTQTMSADAREATGQGRHRGPVSVQDGESAPHGRHRKQSGSSEHSEHAAA